MNLCSILLLQLALASLAWFCLLSEGMSNNVWILKVTLKGSTLVKRLQQILFSLGEKYMKMKSPEHKRQEKELSPFTVYMIFLSYVADVLSCEIYAQIHVTQ